MLVVSVSVLVSPSHRRELALVVGGEVAYLYINISRVNIKKEKGKPEARDADVVVVGCNDGGTHMHS
jgi:hypothetical protein